MMSSSSTPLHHRQINTTAVVDGSSTTTSSSITTPWSCETNWTVTGGALGSAVTFESFDFPIDSESAGPKPPLLLVPPSTSDHEPCEIKLNFTQKHEIRQVYVRSTARVYEIYYAPDLQSENEYLCTVRCSAASVEEHLLPETDAKNAISVNLEGQNEILPKERVAGENNTGNNEDDWVEIRLPVARVDEGNAYSPNTTRNFQNYYEATAEMNDSEPCMSLTLRLLSLQSKGCVHVDEVYVFADCIDTDDSQNQTVNPEPSANCSLMTMLVPTLLGLSNSRSLQLPDQQSSKYVGKPSETESGPTTELTRYQVPPSASASDKDKVCDMTLRNSSSYNVQESLGGVADSDGIGIRDTESRPTAELTRCEVPPSTSDQDKNQFLSNTHLLEQLVARVTKIEDILLRFEENMLKPLNSIEARLHHVEQQVESLTKNSQFRKSSSSPKSEPKPENSNELSDESESESEKQEDTSDEKPQVNDVSEQPKIEIPKKPVSIDDALAAALAGFSSFTIPDSSFPILPLESPEEECLESNDDVVVSSESPKLTAPEFIQVENDATKSDESTEIPDNSFCLQEISEIDNGGHTTDMENVDQDSVEAVKMLTFDKNDILKYFPDQCAEVKVGAESGVDFETSILEVKFASLENSSLESHLEGFLSFKDNSSTDEGVSKEEKTTAGNDLLVELDVDYDGALQDLMSNHTETPFDSLI